MNGVVPRSASVRARNRDPASGTGVTGSALVRRLLDAGRAVVVLDNKEGYKTDELRRRGAEIVIGTITDAATVARCMEDVEVVHHVAAAFREMHLPDREYAEINIEGTRIVAETALARRVRKFVYCSTCGVHGDVRKPPATEDSPIAPSDYYQRTKYEGERVTLACHERGLPSTIRSTRSSALSSRPRSTAPMPTSVPSLMACPPCLVASRSVQHRRRRTRREGKSRDCMGVRAGQPGGAAVEVAAGGASGPARQVAQNGQIFRRVAEQRATARR